MAHISFLINRRSIKGLSPPSFHISVLFSMHACDLLSFFFFLIFFLIVNGLLFRFLLLRRRALPVSLQPTHHAIVLEAGELHATPWTRVTGHSLGELVRNLREWGRIEREERKRGKKMGCSFIPVLSYSHSLIFSLFSLPPLPLYPPHLSSHAFFCLSYPIDRPAATTFSAALPRTVHSSV